MTNSAKEANEAGLKLPTVRIAGAAQGHTRRIKDFGAHIRGARKERTNWELGASLENDPGLEEALSESWPAPKWAAIATQHAKKGRSKRDLACVRALRDELRTAEGRRFEQRMMKDRSRENARGLRALALQIVEGETSGEEAIVELRELAPAHAKGCAQRTVLYENAGHKRDLCMYEAQQAPGNGNWTVHSLARGRAAGLAGKGATLVDAIADLLAGISAGEEASGGKKAKSPYQAHKLVGGPRARYAVCRRCGGQWIVVREYETAEAAARGASEDHDEHEAWWERWRSVPPSRGEHNRKREPEGEDGTTDPESFIEQCGFRGVQFGNWISGRRQREDLRETSQGLVDLAAALDWPVRALSIGGRLGLAFGARGRAGVERTRVHYEPGARVIAISKPAGPGSLAHEWFHGFDHHVAMLHAGGRGRKYATERRYAKQDNALDELAAAMALLGTTVEQSAMKRRSALLDRRRRRDRAHWATTTELAARAFEAWVQAKLAASNVINDYLVNLMPPDRWPSDDKLEHGYPYPYKDELERIGKQIDNVAERGRDIAAEWAKPAAGDEG